MGVHSLSGITHMVFHCVFVPQLCFGCTSVANFLYGPIVADMSLFGLVFGRVAKTFQNLAREVERGSKYGYEDEDHLKSLWNQLDSLIVMSNEVTTELFEVRLRVQWPIFYYAIGAVPLGNACLLFTFYIKSVAAIRYLFGIAAALVLVPFLAICLILANISHKVLSLL